MAAGAEAVTLGIRGGDWVWDKRSLRTQGAPPPPPPPPTTAPKALWTESVLSAELKPESDSGRFKIPVTPVPMPLDPWLSAVAPILMVLVGVGLLGAPPDSPPSSTLVTLALD